MAEPVVAESVAARPDLTVRPLPTPDPVSDPAPFPEADARPAGPVEAAPMVSPALAAASGRRKSSGRLPLYAGGALAALAAVAGAVWLLNRPDAVPPAPPVVAEAPTTLDALPAAPVAAIPDEGAPVEAASEPVPPVAEVAAAPVVVAPRAAPSPAPASAGPTPRPAPAQAQAAPTPVPPAIAPAPLVEIAPVRPAGPPPTAAERPTADPDAPIATRPQPLDQDD
jgi:Meckel syndrome type 1 protein